MHLRYGNFEFTMLSLIQVMFSTVLTQAFFALSQGHKSHLPPPPPPTPLSSKLYDLNFAQM